MLCGVQVIEESSLIPYDLSHARTFDIRYEELTLFLHEG